jgi:hypothetical protein
MPKRKIRIQLSEETKKKLDELAQTEPLKSEQARRALANVMYETLEEVKPRTISVFKGKSIIRGDFNKLINDGDVIIKETTDSPIFYDDKDGFPNSELLGEITSDGMVTGVKGGFISRKLKHSAVLKISSDLPTNGFNESTIVGMMVVKKVQFYTRAYTLLLLSLVVSLGFNLITKTSLDFGLISFLLGLILILFTNQTALEYRIRKGLYGNNEYEAREILQFIIDHADKTDFTSGGKSKKLLPDAEIEQILKEAPAFEKGFAS